LIIDCQGQGLSFPRVKEKHVWKFTEEPPFSKEEGNDRSKSVTINDEEKHFKAKQNKTKNCDI